jgi:hypothetical protein
MFTLLTNLRPARRHGERNEAIQPCGARFWIASSAPPPSNDGETMFIVLPNLRPDRVMASAAKPPSLAARA